MTGTTNYHTAVPANAEITQSLLEDRYASLDEAITNLTAGGTSLTGLNLGATVGLTISGGVITRTAIAHDIDTESAATTDDLTTINGGAEGDILLITATSASRIVVVKHGTGNISLFAKLDKSLDDVRKTITLRYDGSQWCEISGQPTKALGYNSLRMPSGMPIASAIWGRNRLVIRAGGSTGAVVQEGIAAPVTSGTASASNDTDSSYSNFASGSTIANAAGISPNGGTYNNFRYSHNPLYSIIVRTVDIVAVRMWFGIVSVAPGNVDTIAGATEAACFRYSTVAADAGFVPVTKDASTQNTGAAMNTIATLTRYLLQIEVDSANGRVGFSINNGTPTYMTSNLPASATELSFFAVIYTQASASKSFKMSRMVVEYD